MLSTAIKAPITAARAAIEVIALAPSGWPEHELRSGVQALPFGSGERSCCDAHGSVFRSRCGVVEVGDGPGAIDHRLLDFELCHLAGDRGFCCHHIGCGLIERHLEIALINPRQDLTGLNRFIVAGQNLVNIPGDFCRHGRIVGFHVSVIGGDELLADGPMIPSVLGAASQQRRGREHKRHAPDIEFLWHRQRTPCTADRKRIWNLVFAGAFNPGHNIVVGHGACSLAPAALIWKLEIFQLIPPRGLSRK